jgi:hypothetical protein
MMKKVVCEKCGCVHKVREPSTLGQARYDPLIDIAYENLTSRGEKRREDYWRIEMAGGLEHVRAIRSRIAL